jgi:hypothetical protein
MLRNATTLYFMYPILLPSHSPLPTYTHVRRRLGLLLPLASMNSCQSTAANTPLLHTLALKSYPKRRSAYASGSTLLWPREKGWLVFFSPMIGMNATLYSSWTIKPPQITSCRNTLCKHGSFHNY